MDRTAPTPPANALAPDLPEDIAREAIAFRRRLHGHPELDLHLPRTQAAVLERLEALRAEAGEDAATGRPALETSVGRALSSVVVVLRGGAPLAEGTRRPVVLLRGDMDALPVTEETGLEYAPSVPGTMHACGNDLHTAGLYGALAWLVRRRGELTADVVAMFQPGEETGGGALHMIQEGLLEAAVRPVDAAYAIHVSSGTYPRGVLLSRPGAIQAGCDDLVVTVHGIAAAHGMSAQVRTDCAFPVTANDADAVAFVRRTVEDLYGADAYRELPEPEPGSEDFSEVLQRVPGAYVLLGAVPEGVDPDEAPVNHSPQAVFDDAVVPRAAQVLAELALRTAPVPAS
ncbi:M20/M25/M40 family metallo-hydrolase [Micrococcus luteus]|uniref:M20 metallopeptidase family protein n=1 Tax=Micrococcus luteus TaxID=1270 RepID=UPI00210388AC|nr:M20/M25/M40 family metallo-hydrolase [Micrococcus luteus]UTX34870.1 M20/M25/M40 family metallo-hydrolase [Micrococcus luteus]